MKELTIEEKAKAYDEAIAKGKQIQNTPYTAHWDTMKEVVEHLFPELKETEDKIIIDRIKKAVINYWSDEALDEILAWLEKQGEQKIEQKFFINDKVVHKATGKIWTIHHYLKDTNSYYVEDNDGLLHHYRESELKLVEQKPAWSEEDAEILSMLIELINHKEESMEVKVELITWLKSLKDRVRP